MHVTRSLHRLLPALLLLSVSTLSYAAQAGKDTTPAPAPTQNTDQKPPAKKKGFTLNVSGIQVGIGSKTQKQTTTTKPAKDGSTATDTKTATGHVSAATGAVPAQTSTVLSSPQGTAGESEDVKFNPIATGGAQKNGRDEVQVAASPGIIMGQALQGSSGVAWDGNVQNPIAFKWTPVVPKPKDLASYRVSVWQLMQGQTGPQAIKANQPIITKDVDNLTSLTPLPNFISGTCNPPNLCSYVWSVQALDKKGRPVGVNGGIVSMAAFRYEPAETATRGTPLIAVDGNQPAEQATGGWLYGNGGNGGNRAEFNSSLSSLAGSGTVTNNGASAGLATAGQQQKPQQPSAGYTVNSPGILDVNGMATAGQKSGPKNGNGEESSYRTVTTDKLQGPAGAYAQSRATDGQELNPQPQNSKIAGAHVTATNTATGVRLDTSEQQQNPQPQNSNTTARIKGTVTDPQGTAIRVPATANPQSAGDRTYLGNPNPQFENGAPVGASPVPNDNPISAITIIWQRVPDESTVNWGDGDGTNKFSIEAVGPPKDARGMGRLYGGVTNSRILVVIKKNGNLVCGGQTPFGAVQGGFAPESRIWSGKDAAALLGKNCSSLPPGDYELDTQVVGTQGGTDVALSALATRTFTITMNGQQAYQPPQLIQPASRNVAGVTVVNNGAPGSPSNERAYQGPTNVNEGVVGIAKPPATGTGGQKRSVATSECAGQTLSANATCTLTTSNPNGKAGTAVPHTPEASGVYTMQDGSPAETLTVSGSPGGTAKATQQPGGRGTGAGAAGNTTRTTVTPSSGTPVPRQPSFGGVSVAAGDVNGDGKPDLTANRGDGQRPTVGGRATVTTGNPQGYMAGIINGHIQADAPQAPKQQGGNTGATPATPQPSEADIRRTGFPVGVPVSIVDNPTHVDNSNPSARMATKPREGQPPAEMEGRPLIGNGASGATGSVTQIKEIEIGAEDPMASSGSVSVKPSSTGNEPAAITKVGPGQLQLANPAAEAKAGSTAGAGTGSGPAGLTKTGTGTFTVSNSTYSGAEKKAGNTANGGTGAGANGNSNAHATVTPSSATPIPIEHDPDGLAVRGAAGRLPGTQSNLKTPSPIKLGQTPEQVKAILGPPARVAAQGAKTTYYYGNGAKITFTGGKVTAIE